MIAFMAGLFLLPVSGKTASAVIPVWQQEVHYFIDVELDATKHVLTGVEKIVYINNSPDTLNTLYFNLYVNAFRKNSQMRYFQDHRYAAFGGSWMGLLPDYTLGETEIISVTDEHGNSLSQETDDTVLKTFLTQPVLPGTKCVLLIEFKVQIPVHIRRMGRHNREGIDYTVAQWYPKVCVYDRDGWHLDYYLGREFFGEIGTYDVSITLPDDYIVGAAGKLLNAGNPQLMMTIPSDSTLRYRLRDSIKGSLLDASQRDSIGISDELLDALLSKLGEMGSSVQNENNRRTWRYRQDRIHDFAWCADPDYVCADTVYNHTAIHILHKPEVTEVWQPMKSWTIEILKYMEDHVGAYPYSDLTIAQAGDGGMEYPTITLITGRRGSYSLASVAAHEIIHNWFYGVLANDEVHEAWLDEGITSYYTTRVMESMFGRNAIKERRAAWPFTYEFTDDARVRTFSDYEWWAKQGFEEPVLTHSDRFLTDESYAYGVYTKGHVFMNALEYYFGKSRFDELMRNYFRTYAHRHVSTQTMRRFFEKETGTRMESLFDQWLHTTAKCDYGVGMVSGHWQKEPGGRFYESRIQLRRNGTLVMPVDVFVQLQNGHWTGYRIHSHETDPDIPDLERRPVWNPFLNDYTLILELDDAIKRVVIDTSSLLPDIHRTDNQSGLLPPIEWSFWKPITPPPALNIYRIEHRPSLWFNHPDGLRLGYQFNGKWAVDEHRLKTGFYCGIRNRIPDYQLEYQTPVYAIGRQTELSLQSYQLEGRSSHDISLIKKWYGAGYDYPPYHTVRSGFRYERLFDEDYLPAGVRWDRGHFTSWFFKYQYQPGYRRETLLDVAFESSFLQSENHYAMCAVTFIHTLKWIPRYVDIRYRSFFGYATGDVPAQDLFYFAGASPKEMFQQPLYRSAGTMPRDVWKHGSNRHWYMDGGGSLSGYYNADISSQKLWTHTFEFSIPNPVHLLTHRDLLILNRSEPFLFAEGGIFWSKDRTLLKTVNKIIALDAGVGLNYQLSFIPHWWGRYKFRLECPFWVSRPSLNSAYEKQFKKRWVLGLIKEMN